MYEQLVLAERLVSGQWHRPDAGPCEDAGAISYARVKTDKVDARTLVERLLAAHGVGKVGGWTIQDEIGDIHRFPSAKYRILGISYCRLAAGSKDSGGKQCHRGTNIYGGKTICP